MVGQNLVCPTFGRACKTFGTGSDKTFLKYFVTGVPPGLCELCARPFSSRKEAGSFRRHAESVKTPTPQFKCAECKNFKTRKLFSLKQLNFGPGKKCKACANFHEKQRWVKVKSSPCHGVLKGVPCRAGSVPWSLALQGGPDSGGGGEVFVGTARTALPDPRQNRRTVGLLV